MTARNDDRKAAELSHAWDALLDGQDASATSLEPGLLDTIRLVHAAHDARPLDENRINQIWTNVIDGTAPLWTPGVSALPDDGVSPAIEPAGRTRRPGMRSILKTRVLDRVVRLAWVVVAGFLGGFVAGIGSRLAMRLAGFLTIDSNRSIETENGNTVSEITLGGSLSLGLFGGAIGIGVVLIYLGVRDRLPGSGWRRSALFSTLLLVVFGYVLMDPGNPDYRRFGPPWLNVGTFSALYLIMGFCTSQAYELSWRYRERLRTTRIYRLIRIPSLLLSPVVAGLGLLMMVGVTFLTIFGVPLVALGLLAWLASRLAARWSFSIPNIPGPIQRWGLLAVPMMIGFILTVRGITGILIG